MKHIFIINPTAGKYDSQAENPANTWGVELNYAF